MSLIEKENCNGYVISVRPIIHSWPNLFLNLQGKRPFSTPPLWYNLYHNRVRIDSLPVSEEREH